LIDFEIVFILFKDGQTSTATSGSSLSSSMLHTVRWLAQENYVSMLDTVLSNSGVQPVGSSSPTPVPAHSWGLNPNSVISKLIHVVDAVKVNLNLLHKRKKNLFGENKGKKALFFCCMLFFFSKNKPHSNFL
jgi:hypothetical protein